MKDYLLGGIGVCFFLLITYPFISLVENFAIKYLAPFSSYYLFSVWFLAILGAALATNRNTKEDLE